MSTLVAVRKPWANRRLQPPRTFCALPVGPFVQAVTAAKMRPPPPVLGTAPQLEFPGTMAGHPTRVERHFTQRVEKQRAGSRLPARLRELLRARD